MSARPVTERVNPLSADLDVAGPEGLVRILRSVDAQMFAGFGAFPGMFDAAHLLTLERLRARVAAIVAAHAAGERGVIAISGSGTSGRIACQVATNLNAVMQGSGVPPCFRYLISGGDAALLLSDELPEDDPLGAVEGLQAACEGAAHVLVIGVSCGLSAPYVAGHLDFAMTQYDSGNAAWSAAAVGFNPVELARDAPVEKWAGRAAGEARSFREVARRLRDFADNKPDRFFMVNPVVGPEAVCASSRMKGGSATKVLLEAALAPAVCAEVPVGLEEPCRGVEEGLRAYERVCRDAYVPLEALADVVACAGAALRAKRRLFYLGSPLAGLMGVIDSSEMPDTYGAAFDETRAFVLGGWREVCNVEGDLADRGPLLRIDVEHFVADELSGASGVAGCAVVATAFGGDEPEAVARLAEVLAQARAAGAETRAIVVLEPGAHDELSPAFAAAQACPPPVVLQLTAAESIPGIAAHHEFALKLALNAVSTGAQTLAGRVLSNRMINTGPTNDKIYHRCVDMVAELAVVSRDTARDALLRAIYRCDEPRAEWADMPTSDHIRAATPTGDAALQQQVVLPMAMLLAAEGSLTVEEAQRRLDSEPVVRVALAAALSGSG